MLDISDAQERFSSLIESRSNARTSTPSVSIAINSPLRSIGESLLNKFAYQISSQANIAEQKEKIADEILENIVSEAPNEALKKIMRLKDESDFEVLNVLWEGSVIEGSAENKLLERFKNAIENFNKIVYGLRKGVDIKLLTAQDIDQKTGDIKPSFYAKKDNIIYVNPNNSRYEKIKNGRPVQIDQTTFEEIKASGE